MSDCSGCAWTKDTTECKKTNKLTKMKEMCDVDCFLPYPTDFFNNVDSIIKNDVDDTKFKIDYDDPAMVVAQQFINFHINNSNKKSELELELDENLYTEFLCGEDTLNEPKELEDGYTIPTRFPDLPNREMMYSLLSDDKRSAYYNGPIKWDKIADTQLFRTKIEEGKNIEDLHGKIDNDGVQLEWYLPPNLIDISGGDDSELRGATPPDYASTTGIFITIFSDLIDLSEDDKQKLQNNTMFPRAATIPRRTREQELEQIIYDSQRETGRGYVPFTINKLIDIFMITTDDGTNRELEIRLNNLLNTNETENEAEIISRIGGYESIEELGRSPQDVNYIERKIQKFLGVDTDDFVDVFIDNNNYNSLCSDGFSSRPMEMLGNLLRLDVDDNVDEHGLSEEKYVIRKLLKYVPSLMKKILDISEKYELETCDKVTKKTQLYKEIYRDLFIDSNVLKFELPDLGISEFFGDFNRNIYTKIILLIFIGFIISRIISLFSVNVAVKT